MTLGFGNGPAGDLENTLLLVGRFFKTKLQTPITDFHVFEMDMSIIIRVESRR